MSNELRGLLKVLAAHQPGSTLAILNTVERGQGLFVEMENRLAQAAYRDVAQ